MRLTHKETLVLIYLVDGARLILDCTNESAFTPVLRLGRRLPFKPVPFLTFITLQQEGLIEVVNESSEAGLTEWAATEKATTTVGRRIAA